jgi:hypothetical protein
MWNWLLVKLGLRTDWSNPDNAPPAFSDEEGPHDFSPWPGLPCCALCGGGKLHSVHHGVAFHKRHERGCYPGMQPSVQSSERRFDEGDDV